MVWQCLEFWFRVPFTTVSCFGKRDNAVHVETTVNKAGFILPVIFIKEPVTLYTQPRHHTQTQNQPRYSLVNVFGLVDPV